MTSKEAIAKIKGFQNYKLEWAFDEEMQELAKAAISALEKQTAKKIIVKTQDGNEYENFICPGCNRVILQRSKAAMPLMPYKESYCRKCGQHLKWEESENGN